MEHLEPCVGSEMAVAFRPTVRLSPVKMACANKLRPHPEGGTTLEQVDAGVQDHRGQYGLEARLSRPSLAKR